MIKVTLEFESVDAAIVGLGKFVGTGAALVVKPPRKGRDDKGQPRGAYKPRTGQQADPGKAEGTGQGAEGIGTDTGKTATTAANPTSTTDSAAPAPAAQNGAGGSTTATTGVGSQSAEVTDAGKTATAATPMSTPSAVDAVSPSAPPPTLQQAEAAFKKFFAEKGLQPARELFAKFHIARITELPAEQYAEFIKLANIA